MRFGADGIEYEETGEVRFPNPGEYYLSQYNNTCVMRANDSTTRGVCGLNRERKILRPVSSNPTQNEVTKAVEKLIGSDVANMTRAAFYQHVWGFPAPFEVGAKAEKLCVPEPCPCCKGAKAFDKAERHRSGTIVAFREKCPECLGKGTI